MRTRAIMDQRRKAAEARQEERNKRTPQQQLALLDTKFGEGKGAVKERARLNAQIDAHKAEVKAVKGK